MSTPTFTSSAGVFPLAQLSRVARAALSSVSDEGVLRHCSVHTGALLVRLGLAKQGALAAWRITHAGWSVLAELPIEHTVYRSVSAVWCACGDFGYESSHKPSREAAIGHHREQVKREQAARENLTLFAS